MTKLKDISYLFFSKREEEKKPDSSYPIYPVTIDNKPEKPLYAILVASLSKQFTFQNFGINIAKEISRKGISVISVSIGNGLTNHPLITQYEYKGDGIDGVQVRTLLDNYHPDHDFDDIYNNLADRNLLLINYHGIINKEILEDCVSIINDIILFITPSIDIQTILLLITSIARLNNNITFKIGVTEVNSTMEAEDIYRKVVTKLQSFIPCNINFIGYLPNLYQPRQVVLGNRIVNLVRPAQALSAKTDFEKFSKDILISFESNHHKNGIDVFDRLQNLLNPSCVL